jgi:hypothetical protein
MRCDIDDDDDDDVSLISRIFSCPVAIAVASGTFADVCLRVSSMANMRVSVCVFDDDDDRDDDRYCIRSYAMSSRIAPTGASGNSSAFSFSFYDE